MKTLTKHSFSNKPVLKTFCLGFLVAFAAFLPYLIYDKGLFLYYGDFNVQQIPFYQLANEAIHQGNIWWSWKTDLGANFIGSYSFYLLFSPFFWISLLFPTSFTPYLMAPLLMLKSACAAVTAFIYLRRFVKDENYAILCSLLYAFSGYAVYNIFFNHFHEAIVFFPLLLIGLEEAMTEHKWGRFALAITVNAVVNYWFFIGEVVFVIVYFLVRFTDPKWRLNLKKFFLLAAEVLLGMGLAMVALLPSVMAIMGNPRTTESNLLTGTNLWYYSNPQRYLGIIHSVFFSPDMPALNNWFPDHGAQWSSLSAYLPMFGITGAISWCATNKKHWLKRILVTSAVMAVVPMFNHLFVLLNYSYYARWFYMPTLMLVLATALALENCGEDGNIDFTVGLKYTAAVLAIIILMVGVTPSRNGEEWKFGFYKYLDKFLGTAAITVIGFAVVLWLIGQRNKPNFLKKLTYVVTIGCSVYTFSCLLIGKASYSNNRWITESALPARNQMAVEETDQFYRVDIYEGNDNLGMYWNLPNIQAFHSIVPASLMEFYPEVGVKRDVSSKPEAKIPELRSLLSVKWLYIGEHNEEQSPMNGYEYVDTRYGYNIYENQNYIPMGFAYDYYMNDEDWENTSKNSRARALLYAIYLDDEAIERNSDILARTDEPRRDLTYGFDFGVGAAERAEQACYSFVTDNKGFTAKSNFSDDELVFFSVPWDAGWSATVNGEPVRIEKVNLGFMGVRVPAGDSVIRFEYLTPGLIPGAVVTTVAIPLLLLYLWFAPKVLPRKSYEEITENLSEDEKAENQED